MCFGGERGGGVGVSLIVVQAHSMSNDMGDNNNGHSKLKCLLFVLLLASVQSVACV